MANGHCIDCDFKDWCRFFHKRLRSPSFLYHRSAGLDSSWLPTWPSQGGDGAGPSTAMRSVGLGRVQMMMRHLASVGETYAQTALEDAAWSLWPMNPSHATPSTSFIPPAAGGTGGLHMSTTSRTTNDNIANILAMAETVREVLPHIPDELILQVLFGFTFDNMSLGYSFVPCLVCAFVWLVMKYVCEVVACHYHFLSFSLCVSFSFFLFVLISSSSALLHYL